MPGALVVGQAGGPTAVINASLVGVVDEALRQPAVGDVLGALGGVEGLLRGELVDLRREDPATLAALRATPAAALGATRYRLRPDDPGRLLDALAALGARHFLYVGGNDSADTTHRVALAAAARGYPLQAIAIPKTVDNDLPLTDHCPGYGSAARFVALAALVAGRDTEAMRRTDPVKLLEVPGRNAGWLAAAAALGRREEADAPHLVCPPERPLSLDRFLDGVQRTYDRLGFALAVVAETVRDERGEPLGHDSAEMGAVDTFGHRRLVGAADHLCRAVARRLGLRARWEKPGTLVRTSLAGVSPTDLAEAELVGRAAVVAALAGETDRLVTLRREPGEPYRVTTGLAPLAEVANRERLLPDDYLTPDGAAVTPAFAAYALPLLGGPLPAFARLRGVRVALPGRARP